MVVTHNLGFPRVGRKRELKSALEHYWAGRTGVTALLSQAQGLRKENWQYQAACDYVPVGDFSLYDQVLDMSFLLGNIPTRVMDLDGTDLDHYFQVARGRSVNESVCQCVQPSDMSKWFDTNYHYIVPELTTETSFTLQPERLLRQLQEAKEQGVNAKPVIIGPVTYLWLSKAKGGGSCLDYLDALLPVYAELLSLFAEHGVEWVQMDEPILATELSSDWKSALEKTYYVLQSKPVKLLLTTYFGKLQANIRLACTLPVAGLHIDVADSDDVKKDVVSVLDWLPSYKILSLGVINGRSLWKTDLNLLLDWLEPVAQQLLHRLWLAPSCSLLHVPVDVNSDENMDDDIKESLAFAVQKLEELQIIKTALNEGRGAVAIPLALNTQAINKRRHLTRRLSLQGG